MMQFEWEIWEAWIPFSDKNSKKKRPVVFLSSQDTVVLSLKVTSHSNGGRKEFGEYEIVKWQEAGLLKPSYVQCKNILHVNAEDFTGKQYGKLMAVDIMGIQQMMKLVESK